MQPSSGRTLARLALLVAFGLAACASVPDPEVDRKLGREAAEQVRTGIGIVDDEALNAYLDRVGQRLAASMPQRQFDYRFAVVDQESPNAFADRDDPVEPGVWARGRLEGHRLAEGVVRRGHGFAGGQAPHHRVRDVAQPEALHQHEHAVVGAHRHAHVELGHTVRADQLAVGAAGQQHAAGVDRHLRQRQQPAHRPGALTDTLRVRALGQITNALFEVGGQYRRNM